MSTLPLLRRFGISFDHVVLVRRSFASDCGGSVRLCVQRNGRVIQVNILNVFLLFVYLKKHNVGVIEFNTVHVVDWTCIRVTNVVIDAHSFVVGGTTYIQRDSLAEVVYV